MGGEYHLIKKARKIPIKILMLEALNRRSSIYHPEKINIKEELSKSYTGFRGEQSIDYHLEFINKKTHYVFQDMRLPGIEDTHFQIDNLLLTQSYCVILEVGSARKPKGLARKYGSLVRKLRNLACKTGGSAHKLEFGL